MSVTPKKPVVLIVDDTPTNIRVLAEALHADYQIRVATSGQDALKLLERHGNPDLILLDIMMPEMDGYEVCRRLKANPATRGIPVVFISALNDATDEEYGLRLGAIDYIVKPFHLPIVAARVRNHIDLKLKSDLLESMAMLDGLTNIANRRHFDEILREEWLRARRANQALAILMMDIDHFKNYNDHYGHGAGDACLIRVAAALTKAINRPGDLVARYGGEEFVALLPNADAGGASKVAERVRSQVEALHIPHAHSAVAQWVTISVGYASCVPSGADDAATLLERADRMLYCAKSEGRNRICGEKS